MKKIFLNILGGAALLFGFVFAQNPALTRLYTLLDEAIANDPAVAEVVIGVLDKYESTATPTKKALIGQIRVYIQQKVVSKPTPVVEKPAVPSGYKVLPQQSIDQIMKSIHSLGSTDSPIVVMEFLDFQCPYCKRQHDDQVLDELRNVEFPGKVRTAAVMFPLTGKRHELATQAAESAECAFIQGGSDIYYAHKAGLYANGLKPTMQIIRKVAGQNGLDPVRLQACIDEGHATNAVQVQKNIGRSLGVSGTPGSVILDTRNGAYKTIRGAVQIEVFMDIISQLLRS